MMATRQLQGGMNNSNNDCSLCVITPDKFDGCTLSSWDDWINHFEVVSQINHWNKVTQLLWLQVRLTGQAQKAWRCLNQKVELC